MSPGSLLHWPGGQWAGSWSQKPDLGLLAASGPVVGQGGFASFNRIRVPRAEEVVAEGAATLERVCHLDTYLKVSWGRKAECSSEEPTRTLG